MNFGQLKTDVGTMLGAMQSSDRFYSSIGDWINHALVAVPERAITDAQANMSHFPELRSSWSDVTIADQQYLELPNNLLVIDSVYSFDSASENAIGDDNQRLLAWINYRTMQLVRKGTIAAWPTMWSRSGKRIYFNPTPRTGKTTYVHILGLRKEQELSSDSDEPVLDAGWHHAVAFYAAYLGASKRGWHEDAEKYLLAADREIAQRVAAVGLENAQKSHKINIAGDPSKGR